MQSSCHRAKVVLAGRSGVGKSSIVSRFYRDDMPDTSPTIGAALFRKNVREKNKSINIDIWDTAGQERFRAVAGYYFRGCQYCILVFSLDDRDSFTDLKTWKDACKTALQGIEPVYFLVGNKLDVAEREVSETEIKQYCIKHKIIHYTETSAQTGQGVHELLDAIIADMFKRVETLPIDTTGYPSAPEPVTSQCPC